MDRLPGTLRPGTLALLVIALVCTAMPAGARDRDPPVIYDAVEQVAPILVANFTADLTTLATAKGIAVLPTAGGIDATVTLYKWADAESFVPVEQNLLPGLGVNWETIATQARRQDKRDSTHYLVADYFARGADSTVLGRQLALVAETLLHRIDQIWNTASGFVYGAGEPEGSIRLEQFPLGSYGQDTYEGRLRIHFPVNEEDQGLT